jgi:hypothetical protein
MRLLPGTPVFNTDWKVMGIVVNTKQSWVTAARIDCIVAKMRTVLTICNNAELTALLEDAKVTTMFSGP